MVCYCCLCRYDGRGHIFDLRPYDADNREGREELTSDEIRIERLCEEERYLEMHTDIAERAIQEGTQHYLLILYILCTYTILFIFSVLI